MVSNAADKLVQQVIPMTRRVIRIPLIILLVGACVYFGWHFIRLGLGLVDLEEMVCFDVIREMRHHVQKYDGFRVLTSEVSEHCPSFIDITVISDGKERSLIILPNAKGFDKVKYYFRWKKEGFVLKKEVYERIKGTIPISKEVDEFLAAHVAE